VHEHFVQLYQDPDLLGEAVARYIGAGLERGEAAIIIATSAHRATFLESIPNGEAAMREGKLNVLDAERTLARFMANGMPQWLPFREAIGGLIAELRLRHPTVRAYGEMVDVLWKAGQTLAATRLEILWNGLRRTHHFALLCGYAMANFYEDAAIDEICGHHTHVMSASGETAVIS
jgi:hypothetical protein